MLGAVALLLIPSIPGWHGSPDRHSLFVVTLPIAAVLLVAYALLTVRNLKRHNAAVRSAPSDSAWPLKRALMWLGVATIATALVSEILVHS